MKTRAFHLAMAAWLGLALVPLAGCEPEGRDNVEAVDAERDAEGRTRIHVDGDEVERELQRAGDALDRGAERMQEGAKEAGAAFERGAERADREIGPVLDDAAITAKVKSKLLADPEINPLHIDVDTLDGRVTLSGKVSRPEQRTEAEDLARGTDGVRQVVNRIQVAGQEPPPAASR